MIMIDVVLLDGHDVLTHPETRKPGQLPQFRRKLSTTWRDTARRGTARRRRRGT